MEVRIGVQLLSEVNDYERLLMFSNYASISNSLLYIIAENAGSILWMQMDNAVFIARVQV